MPTLEYEVKVVHVSVTRLPSGVDSSAEPAGCRTGFTRLQSDGYVKRPFANFHLKEKIPLLDLGYTLLSIADPY